MAIAEAWLAVRYNRPADKIVDPLYVRDLRGGDLMEGASREAGSLAGHLHLGELIYLYDHNHIFLAGATEIDFTEDWQNASKRLAGTPAWFRMEMTLKASHARFAKPRPGIKGRH